MYQTQWRRASRHLLGLVSAVWLLGGFLLPGERITSSATEPAPLPWIEDAALYDLACPDPQYAWAVGDQGAIWHTDDGGAHWHQQTSGVHCPLHGVWFVNRQTGWAVGGRWQSYSETNCALVLRTDDGGNSWQLLPTRLPALRQIQFFDLHHGIAWGHGSGSNPAGLFVTADGGRSWRSLGDGPQQLWFGGHFVRAAGPDRAITDANQPVTATSGIVVGRGGHAAQWTARELRPLRSDPFAGRPLGGVTLLPPTGGWLVGAGGLVLQTDDLGHSWQNVPTLSMGHLGQRDFHTVAARDNQVWLAGSPGTHILHSPDGGQTWQQQPTGSRTPIHRLRFASNRHGWAVGSLGTILATRDGGKTWQVQHQGGQRVALLGLFATVDNLPLLALAKLSRAEGYRIAVRVLFEPQADPTRPDLGLEARLNAGLTQLHVNSATTAWQFPLPSARLRFTPATVAAELNRRHDGQAAQRLVADLIRQIRLWRPEAVLVPSADSESAKGKPLDNLLRQAVLAAVEQAADSTQQIDQITQLGLAPWQVGRVLGWLSQSQPSAIGPKRMQINAEEIAYHDSQTLGDLIRVPQDLLDGNRTGWSAQPAALDPRPKSAETFIVLANRRGGPVGGNLLSGLNLSPGGAVRRRPVALTAGLLSTGGLGKLRKQVERQRNLRQLVRTTSGNKSQEGLLTQVAKQADTLNPAAGAALLMELAQRYRTEGQLDRAADVLQQLIRRDRQDPLAESALRWLVSYYASGEAAHISRHAHASPVRQAAARGDEPRAATAPSAHSALVTSSLAGNLSSADRLTRAVQLARAITAPTLATDPTIRWPQAVAQRKRGFTKNANRTLLALSHRAPDNPWQACAQTEAWLAHPQRDPPRKPIATCRRAETEPHLDGRLDEALWETARPIRLSGGEWAEARRRNGEGGEPDTGAEDLQPNLWIAYDDEYLYLALRCPKIEGVDYPTDQRPRPHDGDLSAHDRVRLLLDIDRDYRSYYQLTIDSRGWTAESCFGNTYWNPQWFVASGGNQHSWSAEAAIPLGELAGDPVQPRHVWAMAVDRVVPSAGLQTWVGPTFDQPGPENFGLLIFD